MSVRATTGHLPLAGVQVVDLTRMLSGPFCTTVLADLGADVVKIEQPGVGDSTRAFPPHTNGYSHYFLSVNRGKRSVALDLKSQQGRALLRRLLETADVLVENFRPGALDRLDLSPDDLVARYPHLVVCALSGFGLQGAYRDKISFDIVTQAMSGVMSVNGERTGPPMRIGLPMGDLAGSMYAVIAVLAALRARDNDPARSGMVVDLSLQDSLVAMLGYYAGYAHLTGRSPARSGSGHLTGAPYGAFEATDGHVVVAAFTDNFWPGTCRVIDRLDLVDDPKYCTMAGRNANQDEINALLRETIRTNTVAHWCRRFDEEDVPAGPVMDVLDVLNDEHLQSRGMIFESEHPEYGRFRTAGSPLPFSGGPQHRAAAAPALGEHTREVLAGIGCTDDELAELLAAGVIGAAGERAAGERAAGEQQASPIAGGG